MHVLVMRQRASHSNAEKVGHKLPPDRQASRTTRIKSQGTAAPFVPRLAIFAVVADDELVVQVVTDVFFCTYTPFENPRSCLMLNTRFSRVLHVRHISGEISDITCISLHFWKAMKNNRIYKRVALSFNYINLLRYRNYSRALIFSNLI